MTSAALQIEFEAPTPATLLQFPKSIQGVSKQSYFNPVRFPHNGRRRTIFQLVPDGQYYFTFQIGGKRHKRSLDSQDATEAIARAKVFIDSFSKTKWTIPKLRVARGEFALDAAITIYRKVAIDIAPRTVQNNILALLKIVEVVAGGRQQPADIQLAQLTPELLRRYQEIISQNYCAEAAKDEPSQRIAKERAYRSSKSLVNQARSLFSRRPENDILAAYQKAGIKIPANISEFMTAKLLGSRHKAEYNQPDDAVVKKAFLEIENQLENQPDVYKAFWLAAGAGLRRGEIAQARWEHLREINGALHFVGGIGKDGREIKVKFQSKAAAALQPLRKTEGFIIEERSRWDRKISAWMRSQGWIDTEKCLHELRAYVGSKLFEKNPQVAMKFMRHKKLEMTQSYYGRYIITEEQPDVL